MGQELKVLIGMQTDKYYRAFFWMLGFAMAVTGGITVVAYLNLFTAGYHLREFFAFTSRRIECYLLPFGLLILTCSIYYPEKKK